MLGVFYCSVKGQAILRNSPYRAFQWKAPAGCRGGRNKILSPGKGITWPWHGQGRDSGRLHISLLYIPQLFPRELRRFFLRHISVNSLIRLQNNTLFLLWAYLPFCGCAFFSRSVAHIFRRSGAAHRPSSPENCFSKFQDWRI